MYGADITKWLYSQATAANNDSGSQPQLMDPLSCMIRLGLIYYKDEGTKISIQSSKIYYQSPTILQGASRWYNGDNRNDLHHLHYPIVIACENYNPIENREIGKIFEYSIKGLTKLKKAYTRNSDSNLVSHCLNHYIDIIMDFMRLPEKIVASGIPIIPGAISITSPNFSTSASASVSGSMSSANSIADSPIHEDDRMSVYDDEQVKHRRMSIHEIARRQQDTLQINFKTLWLPEEIHIIHELLELGEKKKDHPEKIEYIVRAIENLLEEKDTNIRSLITRISHTL